MKNNSHTKKSSFRLIGILLSLLAIGIMFGRNVMVATIVYMVVFAVAIFILGVAIVLTYTIKEEIEQKRNLNDEGALSD